MRKSNAQRLVNSLIDQWPMISKQSFRKRMNLNQKLVWDNFEILKDSLGLTDNQVMLLRTFKADFDSCEKIRIDDDILINGLRFVASWNLVFQGEPIFDEEQVTEILGGKYQEYPTDPDFNVLDIP